MQFVAESDRAKTQGWYIKAGADRTIESLATISTGKPLLEQCIEFLYCICHVDALANYWFKNVTNLL